MTGYSHPRPISETDDVAAFDSGEPTLDEYIRSKALNNHAGGASRCFVTCHDGRVVGYYALASASVSRAEAAGKVRRNMPNPIPVILLSRLAIDRKHQGRGLGENLLRDAIGRCVQAAEQIGVRAILVHAINDEARSFYTRYQFEPSPTDPLHLMLLIKDAKGSVPGLGDEQSAEQRRRAIVDDMVAAGGDRAHLESLTEEQFVRIIALMALTNTDTLRQADPEGADAMLAAVREASGIVDRDLRRITLSDSTGVLVDGSCEQTDDEIRAAFESDQ